MSAPRFNSYNASGTDWLGELPPEWGVRLARRLFQQVREVAREGDEQLSATQRYGVVPQKLFMELEDQKVMLALGGLGNFKHVEKDDFVISLRSFQGGIEYSAYSGCVSPAYTVLRARNEIFASYYAYTFKSNAFVSALQTTTDGIRDGKNISYDQFGSVSLPLPPLPEQTAIAAFLDRETAKIDALVEDQKRLIDLLKEKRRAVISHAVTKGPNPDALMKDTGIEWLGEIPEHWDVTKIGRYISILSGFAFPSSGFSLEESDMRLLRGTNVGVGSIKWDDTVYWPRKNNDGLGRFELRENQIVVGMDRPWIKEGVRVARVSADDLPCLLLQRVTALSVRDGMTEDFAFYLLSSDMFVAYFTPDMTGVSVPHLSPEQIANFVVPIPPLEDQAKIVQHIQKEMAAINALSTEAEAAVLLLQERRAALISAVVTGRINIQKRTDVQHDQSEARNAVGFEIVRQLAHRPTFGRVKLQKIVYLAETYAGVKELNGHYQREAAGPLDRQLIADIETLLRRNGDVSIDQPEGRGGAVIYRFAGPSTKAEREDLGLLLGDRRERFEQVLNKVGDLDTKGAEAVATLFAVWNDALIDQTPMTDEGIITAFLSEWHPEKPLKFKRDELHIWLGWMRRNGIIPTGRGPRTQTGRLVI